jgi:hypothetical protein
LKLNLGASVPEAALIGKTEAPSPGLTQQLIGPVKTPLIAKFSNVKNGMEGPFPSPPILCSSKMAFSSISDMQTETADLSETVPAGTQSLAQTFTRSRDNRLCNIWPHARLCRQCACLFLQPPLFSSVMLQSYPSRLVGHAAATLRSMCGQSWSTVSTYQLNPPSRAAKLISAFPLSDPSDNLHHCYNQINGHLLPLADLVWPCVSSIAT